MATSASSGSTVQAWESVAGNLEALAAGPTAQQRAVARVANVDLAADLPAPVAGVVLRHHLRDALFMAGSRKADIPEALFELSAELNLKMPESLVIGIREEVSAWFTARYMVKTARGLRSSRPVVGDIVQSPGWRDGPRVISSIGKDGRVYMKGQPHRKAWPNHLEVVMRQGEASYDDAVRAIDGRLRNGKGYAATDFSRFEKLSDFELREHVPPPEAVRALEELLESAEPLEEPLQALLARHPSLLSATVVGNWKTFVIPKPKLGSEYIPDFLVLGLNSVGPQWVMVELEAARHPIEIKDGNISAPVRTAVKQIQDWREWLENNVAYAQDTLGLYGLTARASGLVVIGRDDPRPDRQSARFRSEGESRIAIHTWDWLLRNAQNLAGNATQFSDFALRNVAGPARGPVQSAQLIQSDTEGEDDWDIDENIDVDSIQV